MKDIIFYKLKCNGVKINRRPNTRVLFLSSALLCDFGQCVLFLRLWLPICNVEMSYNRLPSQDNHEALLGNEHEFVYPEI